MEETLTKRILEEMNEHEFPPMSAEDAAILANMSINGEYSSSGESVGDQVHDAEPGRRGFLPEPSGESDSSTQNPSTGLVGKINNVLGRFAGKRSDKLATAGLQSLNRNKS